MILTNRLFTRRSASREAKSIYIFCEGIKTEVQYFHYFKQMDSRINIEVYQLKPDEDNSPLGLLNIANQSLKKTEENPNPKYEVIEGDEVWFVLDTDTDKLNSRKPQIEGLRNEAGQNGWNVAESNPCFETWLYFHLFKENPDFKGINKCLNWKRHLHKRVSGFDSRRHPIFIKEAIENSSVGYSESNGVPNEGSTQVFKLAESIYSIVYEHIIQVRQAKGI